MLGMSGKWIIMIQILANDNTGVIGVNTSN
jgi:hypothetical protein